MERLVIDAIGKHLDTENLVDKQQFGFCKGKSAEKQLVVYFN